MKYTKASPEWQAIIARHPLWFAPETMNFWHSKVLWDSLTPAKDGWMFLTLEDNYNKSARMYSVRLVSPEHGFATPSFQQTSNRRDAMKLLKSLCWDTTTNKENHADILA